MSLPSLLPSPAFGFDEPVSQLLDRILLAAEVTSRRDLIDMIEMAKDSAIAHETGERDYARICHRSAQSLGSLTSVAAELCAAMEPHIHYPSLTATVTSADSGPLVQSLLAVRHAIAEIDPQSEIGQDEACNRPITLLQRVA